MRTIAPAKPSCVTCTKSPTWLLGTEMFRASPVDTGHTRAQTRAEMTRFSAQSLKFKLAKDTASQVPCGPVELCAAVMGRGSHADSITRGRSTRESNLRERERERGSE